MEEVPGSNMTFAYSFWVLTDGWMDGWKDEHKVKILYLPVLLHSLGGYKNFACICPLADLHQIWFQGSCRRCDHLWQFFWQSLKGDGIFKGSKISRCLIDKACCRAASDKMHIPPYGALAWHLFTYLLTDSVTCHIGCLLFVMTQQNDTFWVVGTRMWGPWPPKFQKTCLVIGKFPTDRWSPGEENYDQTKKHTVNLVSHPYSVWRYNCFWWL